MATGQRQGDVFVQPDPFKVTRTMRWSAVRMADGQELTIVKEGNGHVLRAVIPAGATVAVRIVRQQGATVAGGTSCARTVAVPQSLPAGF